MNSSRLNALDSFEQIIVLKSARLLPLLLSCVATMVLFVAIVALLYSFTPSQPLTDLAAIPEPPEVSVAASEAREYLRESDKGTLNSKKGTHGESAAPVIEGMQIATALHALEKHAHVLNVPASD